MSDRELTPDTKWIICMWDIRGEDIAETAHLMKRSLRRVTEILNECKADGYYDKVKAHIEYFDSMNAKHAIEGFAAALRGERGYGTI